MTGTTVGHYRIEEQLGAGGMGTVYRAIDTRLGRVVALKFLREDLLNRPDALERFHREARAISALNHPNICTLFDVDESDGRPYLIMEYLEGTTVSERLARKRKPFKVPELIDVGTQVADALDAAHSRGLVHRDIKPSNIFLTTTGQAKVLDFGVAKIREGATAPAARGEDAADKTMTLTNGLTRAGSIIGTLPYMSPEQIRGEEPDARSDVFSLGATLYELTTGRRAFPGRTNAEIQVTVLKDQPTPPKEVIADVPIGLNELILTALEKDRAMRYQSAAELRAALLRTKREAAPEMMMPRPSPLNNWRLRVLAAAALLCALAAGIWSYRYVERRTLPYFQHIQMSRLTADGNAVSAAISPDGRYLAYAVNEGGKQSFRVKQIASNSEVQTTPPSDAEYRNLTFSPDGNLVYYGSGIADLYAVPTLGGVPRMLNGDVDSTVTFSPNGKQIAFYRQYPAVREHTIFTANLDGSGERKISSRSDRYYYVGGVAWSPDGETIACGAGAFAPEGQYSTLMAIPADGAPEKVITRKKWLLLLDVRWLAHGRGLIALGTEQAFGPAQIWYIPYPRGPVERITNDLNNYGGLSLTADSSAFVTVQLEKISNIWITEKQADAPSVQVTTGGARLDGFTGISWAPDGRIVYGSRASGDSDIWIMRADGSGAKQLTAKSGVNAQPRVSPDGRLIIFTSGRMSGKPHIWRMDIDGNNPRKLTNGDGEFVPDCCIDGKWVVYASLGQGAKKLWRVSVDGGSPEPIADMIARFPIISPDSRLVAFNYYGAPDRPNRGVAVATAHHGVVQQRFGIQNDDPSEPHVGLRPMCWRPDARALYFLRDSGGVSNIWEQSLDRTIPVQVTHFTDGRIFSFAWSRDGKRLAVAKGSITSDVILVSNVN